MPLAGADRQIEGKKVLVFKSSMLSVDEMSYGTYPDGHLAPDRFLFSIEGNPAKYSLRGRVLSASERDPSRIAAQMADGLGLKDAVDLTKPLAEIRIVKEMNSLWVDRHSVVYAADIDPWQEPFMAAKLAESSEKYGWLGSDRFDKRSTSMLGRDIATNDESMIAVTWHALRLQARRFDPSNILDTRSYTQGNDPRVVEYLMRHG